MVQTNIKMGQLDQSPSVEAWSGFGPWFKCLGHLGSKLSLNGPKMPIGPNKLSEIILEFGPFFVMLNKNDCYK